MKFFMFIGIMLLISCTNRTYTYDASGVFEAEEIIVSAEATGKIEKLTLTEGDKLYQGQFIGYIDTLQLHLQKLQLAATIKALASKKPDANLQLSTLKKEIEKANTEKNRIERLLKDGAATAKQLEDAQSHIQILHSTLEAQHNTLLNSIESLTDEQQVYAIQIEQINDLIQKSRIVNPVSGTVLAKYAHEKEIIMQGKPLYKIANMQHVFLRAYVVAAQLEHIKTGQKAIVEITYTHAQKERYEAYVSWIADEAEFTPKTIQTIDERQSLIYAIKLKVHNADERIKLGMYADVIFTKK